MAGSNMYTLTVGTAEHYEDISQKETRLKVPFAISDENGIVYEQIQSFPLSATADEIKESLERALRTYTEDSKRYEEAHTRRVVLEESLKTATEISNLSLYA